MTNVRKLLFVNMSLRSTVLPISNEPIKYLSGISGSPDVVTGGLMKNDPPTFCCCAQTNKSLAVSTPKLDIAFFDYGELN